MKAIKLTIADIEEDFSGAVSAGIDSYVIRCDEPTHLLSAILAFCADHSFMSGIKQGAAREDAVNALETLTVREMEIAEYVKQGLSNKIIAYKLKLSENTVRNHIRNIMEKLGLKNRVQLATLALKEDWRRYGLVAPAEEKMSLTLCI